MQFHVFGDERKLQISVIAGWESINVNVSTVSSESWKMQRVEYLPEKLTNKFASSGTRRKLENRSCLLMQKLWMAEKRRLMDWGDLFR
jgi:hypothetical protein